MSTARQAPWHRSGTVAIYGALGLSILVHVATFIGMNLPGAFPILWGLHVAAIVAFGAMILTSRRSNAGQDGFTLPKWPAWSYLLVVSAFLYTIINFAIFFALTQGGAPEVRDGMYVLSDHGRIIRTLTADEYRWQQVYIVRGFSGHWIFFLLLPALYFAFRDPFADGTSPIAPAV